MFCYNSWLIRMDSYLLLSFVQYLFSLFCFLQFADSIYRRSDGSDWHNCNWTIFVGTCTNFCVHLLAIVHRFEDGPVEIDISQCSLANMRIFESGTGKKTHQHSTYAAFASSWENLTFVMCFQAILFGIKWISWGMTYSLILTKTESFCSPNATKWRANDVH